MGYKERKKIIEEIEKIRDTKVITYVITTKPKINTFIEHSDIRTIFEHLNNGNFQDKKIDLFIYSNGGVSTVAWALTNLIREFSKEFSVLVPSNSFSCATSIALGADKIIMTKMGTLGPIDPTVINAFNPIINGQQVGISVEDMNGYLKLLKDKFEIKDQNNVLEAFAKLATDIRPLALGNAYRHYLKARDDAKKLLNLHLDPQKEKNKIDKIIEIMVEKLYFHGHHVNREEAKSIGLDVTNAEKIDDNLSKLMWNLYINYETELDLKKPYKDEMPTSGNKKEIPIKFIESSWACSEKIIEQEFVDKKFPKGSSLISNKGQIAVFVPPNQILPIVFMGQPVVINEKIYDKQEVDFWKNPYIYKLK